MNKSGGKRYRALSEGVEKGKVYKLDESIDKLKSFHKSKFDETVELAIRLGVDVKKLTQPVRNSVVLPHGVGKPVRILVFAAGEDVDKAKQAGADIVGGQELADKVKEGFLDFDNVVATPDMMKTVSPLGKVLGPRGLMPNPKSGTVTKDIQNIIAELKKGRIDFKMDKDGNLHIPVGKVSFDRDKLVENTSAALNAVFAVKPASVKGNYVRSASLSLTMSPSLQIDVSELSQESAAE
ncbi:MAG: 50S ribosomal protein L1 [Candidatus Omnitrophica bacterium]|nr:50S ribosomal protein L1 [Candidatus Omnitrophota bacterium]